MDLIDGHRDSFSLFPRVSQSNKNEGTMSKISMQDNRKFWPVHYGMLCCKRTKNSGSEMKGRWMANRGQAFLKAYDMTSVGTRHAVRIRESVNKETMRSKRRQPNARILVVALIEGKLLTWRVRVTERYWYTMLTSHPEREPWRRQRGLWRQSNWRSSTRSSWDTWTSWRDLARRSWRRSNCELWRHRQN